MKEAIAMDPDFPDGAHLLQLGQDLWAWPKSRAAVMVGAGFSLNAEPLPGASTCFPLWKQLTRAMFDELHPTSAADSKESAEKRKIWFAGMNALRIASEYEATFGRRKLEELIRRETPDPLFRPGELHGLLLQLPWSDVFTTNYDTLLERTDIDGRNYQPVTTTHELTTAVAPRIVKLHGSLPSQTPFIVTEEDYRSYPRRFAPFVNTVRQSLIENTFVLLGFSGDDPNFLEWTGWIRDELGEHHAPIYLVGPLRSTSAERSLLKSRGVTPIDLSPVFPSWSPEKIHTDSLEWFLRSLHAQRPARPENWPMTGVSFSGRLPGKLPRLFFSDKATPEAIPSSRPKIPENYELAIFSRWRFERLRYPGWIVANGARRSLLWENTKEWISYLARQVQDWTAEERALLFREINWRLETALIPLFPDSIGPFEKAVDDLFQRLSDGTLTLPRSEFLPTSDSDLVDAWFELAFGLLREARESYDARRWGALDEKIGEMSKKHPAHLDRRTYESTLWAMWNVKRDEAKSTLSEWRPASRSPLASLWKAGLLAELDETGYARELLRKTLTDIRKALHLQGQSIELLSLEGWCTYMLYLVEPALDYKNVRNVHEEFRKRWQELKTWDCSPWFLREEFTSALARSTPKLQKAELTVQGFDPGKIFPSRSSARDQISQFLPGFAYIRLFEKTGLPMRVQYKDTAGDALVNACGWIAPFIGFWSPALLIRAGKLEKLKETFLSRAQIAVMDQDLATSVFDWCLNALRNETPRTSESIAIDSMQERLLDLLPEVVSRLAFRVGTDRLKEMFPLAISLYKLRLVRQHGIVISLFERLFQAANGELLLEWLPEVIGLPLYTDEDSCKEPIEVFPVERYVEIESAAKQHPVLAEKTHSATERLIKKSSVEIGGARKEAILRLIRVYAIGGMTADQQRRFGELLWSERAEDGLPDLPLYRGDFLRLPVHSQDIDVYQAVKNSLLPFDFELFAPKGSLEENIKRSEKQASFFHEVLHATKPMLLSRNWGNIGIEWSAEEGKRLYSKIFEWWDAKKHYFLTQKNINPHYASAEFKALHTFGVFFAHAVLPTMDWATENDWQELSDLFQNIKEVGVFPTVALPYVLLHRSGKADSVEKTIADDLRSDDESAVAAAADAVYNWIRLAALKLVPPFPPRLMTLLTARIIVRRKPGILPILGEMTILFIEAPDELTALKNEMRIDLLIASLIPWRHATCLPAPEEAPGDFCEDERPALRTALAEFAFELQKWCKRIDTEGIDLSPLELWRKSCTDDPLPEVRRAFTIE